MRRFRPTLDTLAARDTPAVLLDLDPAGTLSVVGDGGADSITQSVSGTGLVVAANAPVTLTQAAYDAGFRANGNTAAGPRSSVLSELIDLGPGTNTLNLRATDAPTHVLPAGATTTNLTGNSAFGDLGTILGAVSVDGDGDDVLLVSDTTATAGNANVYIDASGVYGLAGAADDVPVYTAGTFRTFTVQTSNSSTLAESVTVAGSCSPLTLKCQAGPDTVHVVGDTTGTVNLGAGADTFTIDSGVTLTGYVVTGGPPSQGDHVYYGEPLYGTVTRGVLWGYMA